MSAGTGENEPSVPVNSAAAMCGTAGMAPQSFLEEQAKLVGTAMPGAVPRKQW